MKLLFKIPKSEKGFVVMLFFPFIFNLFLLISLIIVVHFDIEYNYSKYFPDPYVFILFVILLNIITLSIGQKKGLKFDIKKKNDI